MPTPPNNTPLVQRMLRPRTPRIPTGGNAPAQPGRNPGSVMAPFPGTPPDQMLQQGNDALEAQGLPAYQPQQNMVFPSTNQQGQPTFMGRHPGLAGALEGALITAASMPSTGPVASTGDGISAAAKGFLGMVGAKRQFATEQAMLPMQMAQQAAQMKATMAPQALTTPAGIVMRDPLTGGLSHGASLAEIAGQGQTPSFDEQSVMGMVPDANPQEQLRLRAAARVAQGLYDPQKRAEYVGNAVKQISDDRFHQQQHDDTMGMQEQFHDDSMNMQQQNHQDAVNMQQQNLGIRQQMLALQQQQAANKGNDKNNTILNHSYEYNANKLDKVYQPIMQFNQRLARLKDNLDLATPQADSLIAPEMLSVVAGGNGTGVRVNDAEINRVGGGRSKVESLKAALQQYSLDPAHANSITPAQRQQMKQIVNYVAERANDATGILDDARNKLIDAPDVITHRQITTDALTRVNAAFAGTNTGAPGGASAGGGMITVQIPGHPPGHIPAAAKAKFLQENPNAQVLNQ